MTRTGYQWTCDCGANHEDCLYLDEAETIPVCIACGDSVKREPVAQTWIVEDYPRNGRYGKYGTREVSLGVHQFEEIA